MNEACYCGRAGEIKDRVPVWLGNEERALCCPNPICGHLEHLHWLPAEARNRTLDEAEARQAQRRNQATSSIGARPSAPTTQAAADRRYGAADAALIAV